MRKGEQSCRREGRRIRDFGGAVPAWPLLRGTLIRFLPAALFGVVAVYLVQERHREEALSHLRQEGRRVVEAQSNLMRSAFAEVALDIGRVLQDRDVRGFALGHSSATHHFLSLELLNLALWRDSYDLVQVFDAARVEVVAVEREPGAATPAIVARLDGNTSSDPLTDATFEEVASLEAGGILVSFGGTRPTPSAASTVNPAFRFVAPIRDPSGGLRGVLALRWRADRLLESMRQAVPDTRARLALVSESGHWLVGEEGEDGWRFRRPEAAHERFDQVHTRVWESMHSSDGSDTLEVDDGLWMQGSAVLPRRGVTSRASFEDLQPAVGQRDQHQVWRIGYFLPRTVLREREGSLVLPFRGGAFVLLALFAAGLSYQDLRLRSALRRVSESDRKTAEQLAFSEALVDGLGVPLFVKDLRGRILRCNAAFSRLTGHELDACAAMDAAGFSPAESAGRHAEMSARVMATRQAVSYDSQVIDGNGGTRAVIVTRAPLVGLDGEVTGEVGALHDVSERQRTENELRLAAGFFEHSNEGILICDAADRIVRVNPAFTEITGYSADEVFGRQPSFLRATTPDGEGATEMARALSGSGTWQGELVNRRKSGALFPCWLSVSVVRDDAGQVSGYVSIFSDITERRAHEERVRWLAHHDFVTGLANRNLLIDRAELALRRTARDGRQVALLAIDLDRFKAVNDQMGHAAGDRLLRLVADRLEGVVRQTDTVARVGGDEFVVMLNDVSRPEHVARVAEKIVAALQQPFELEEGRAAIGASVGASIYPRDGTNLDELLQVADAEMYRAKREGRKGFRIAEAAVQQDYAPVCPHAHARG